MSWLSKKRAPLMTAREAAEYLNISLTTLSKVDKDIVPYRTPGRHRRYSVAMLNQYLQNSKKKRGRR